MTNDPKDPNDPTATLKAVCPNCGTPRSADEAFCEVCGLDFASGKLPAAPPPPSTAATATATGATSAVDTGWVVVIEVDTEFFESNENDASLTPPEGVAAKEIPLRGDEVLIGRTSASANVHPDVDLGSDVGVSRKHATLKRRGDEWFIVDLGSTNGTEVDGKVVPAGEERAVAEGTVVHVGAWTKLTLQRAKTS